MSAESKADPKTPPAAAGAPSGTEREAVPGLPVLAARFAAVFPHVAPETAPVALALYRLLAQGAPVGWAALAAAAGEKPQTLQRLVRGWPGVYETAAGITGFGGLSVLAVSPHVLRVRGRTLHTRCAWDTLFLPELLGAPAAVASVCAVTGAPVRLQVTATGVSSLTPAAARLSMLEPHPRMTADLTQHF